MPSYHVPTYQKRRWFRSLEAIDCEEKMQKKAFDVHVYKRHAINPIRLVNSRRSAYVVIDTDSRLSQSSLQMIILYQG
jgi:hypothetical protein